MKWLLHRNMLSMFVCTVNETTQQKGMNIGNICVRGGHLKAMSPDGDSTLLLQAKSSFLHCRVSR